MTALPDDTIHLARTGDEPAFRRLVERYYPYVYRVAYGVLGNEDEAAEAAHMTFINIWRNFASYDPRRAFTTWLYRVAANAALDRARALTRAPRVEFREHPMVVAAAAGDDPAMDTERSDLVNIVRSLVPRLSPAQRLVFALRDLEDLSIAEVGAITGQSEASVKTNLSYARREIRRLLDTEYGLTSAV